jgi:iron complex transport system ATP-binding protein
MRSIINLEGLSVVQGGLPILEDISWRVEPDEHWAILGHNGSGKTTLLNVVSGDVAPSQGTVEVFGRRRDSRDWDMARQKVGLVSSSLVARISPSRTALDAVLSGASRGRSFWRRLFSNDRRRALRALRLVGCRELARRPWGVLSQGEKQRVLIARGLVARPRLLILDEPCAGLDFLARERFLRFLRRFGFQKGSPTLVMATHHADEIPSVFKRVLLLRKGRVSAAGDIGDTLTSDNASKAFGAQLRIERQDHRFHMARARS